MKSLPLTLIHWKPAEAAERAQVLRDLGYSVTVHSDQGSQAALRAEPPAAFVIDLDRLPSHGREIGGWLRRQVATRGLPLVFVGGRGDKVDLVRALLPDATFTDWAAIASDLPAAIDSPPARPVVPGTMAGYSGTPLPKKLNIRAGDALLLIDAPEDFETRLGALPEGVTIRRNDAGSADVILLFALERLDLLHRFPMAAEAMREGARLWLAWPKKASGLQTDLGDAAVRAQGLAHGLVDYKVCAIDATWSGLCFACQGSLKKVVSK